MEGVTMLDQRTYLTRAGLAMDSYLIRKDPSMSETDFGKRVAGAAPIPFEWQKNFYLLVDGESTLFDLLRACPLPKAEWVPVMFNLISCEIVILSDRPAQTARKNLFFADPVDRASIDGAIKVASREETGIFTYPMMAYFLENEFSRFESGGAPFALVLFEMMYKSQYGLEPPSPTLIQEVVRRVKMIQRKIDLFGHWETFSFALILPLTDAAATSLVVMRLAEVIRDSSLEGDINKDNLALAVGVGNVPEDCRHMGVLLAGVKEAKERAKRGASPIVLMRSLESSGPSSH
jgi:GGDEF domain-containing protein